MNTEQNREKWVEKCVNIMEMGGKSKFTIKNYKCGWKRFLNYYPENKDISKLTEEDLLTYFKKEFLDKNMAGSTYNLYLCSVRFLYSVCFRRELNRILLPNKKLRKRYPVIIPKEEFIRIFNLESDIRHKCWLLLSFCCGLRVIDISLLKIEYIDSRNHKLKVLGKGNKERFTILPDIVIKYLRLYYKEKNFSKKTGYLFEGSKGKEHISAGTITDYFVQIKKEFHIAREITEHSLRHSFATYYLMNGGDLLILKEMLGHKSLNSTIIYVHLAHNFNSLKGINYGK